MNKIIIIITINIFKDKLKSLIYEYFSANYKLDTYQ